MNNFTLLKKFLFLFIAVFTVGSLQAQAPGLEVVSVTTCPDNNTVDVDVKAMDWTLVTSMQFTMNWDTEILQYDSWSTDNADFDGMLFGTGGAPNGEIGASWFDGSATLEGVTTNDVVAFTLTFNVVGEIGDATAIEFSSAPFMIEFTVNENGNIEVVDPNLVMGNVSLEVPETGSTTITDETNTDADGAISLVVTGGTPGYTYMWNVGTSEPTISGLSAGDYNCTVTDASGCAADLGPFTVGSIIVNAVNEIDGLNVFTLTPNPANEFTQLNVELDQTEELTIKVFSIDGKEVYNHTVNGQSINLEIPLTNLANGAYFVELNTNTGKAIEKLIIAE